MHSGEGPNSSNSTPNISPTGSLMRGQHPAILETLSAHSTVHSHLETLVRQNEQQRVILGELFAGFGLRTGPSLPLPNTSSPSPSPSTGMSSGRMPSDFGMPVSSGGSIHRQEQGAGQTSLERQLQVTARENESLRRENDALKREIDRLRRVAAASAVGSGSGSGAQG